MAESFTRDDLDQMATEQVAQAASGDRWKRAGCRGGLRLVSWSVGWAVGSIDLEVLISCDESGERVQREHTMAEVVELWSLPNVLGDDL